MMLVSIFEMHAILQIIIDRSGPLHCNKLEQERWYILMLRAKDQKEILKKKLHLARCVNFE